MKLINLVLVILLFACLGCNSYNRAEVSSSKIINDIFLDVADTTTYLYNTLRPTPKMERFYGKSIKIGVTCNLDIITKWRGEIQKELAHKDLFSLGYKKLFDESIDIQRTLIIDTSIIKQTGKFEILYACSPNNKLDDGKLAGYIQYYSPVFNDKLAIVVATVRDGIKSGITRMYYLQYKKSKWTIIKKVVLEVW